MPISEAQLAANRANAQKSTGPKTAEGKARSAMNGFKSNFTGLSTVMADEDRLAQYEFVRTYVADLDPRGAVELQLARTLALDNWRLNRIKTGEENIFAYDLVLPRKVFTNDVPEVEHAITHAWTLLSHSEQIGRISLYEDRLNRCISRNLEHLQRRQAERRARPSPVNEAIHEPNRQPLPNQPHTAENGFAPPKIDAPAGAHTL